MLRGAQRSVQLGLVDVNRAINQYHIEQDPVGAVIGHHPGGTVIQRRFQTGEKLWLNEIRTIRQWQRIQLLRGEKNLFGKKKPKIEQPITPEELSRLNDKRVADAEIERFHVKNDSIEIVKVQKAPDGF